MKKENHLKIIENYEKLYEEMKIKYQNKEKENQQLKQLLKLRDKEIITLKKRLKNQNENINCININNNSNEINPKYIQELIKAEIENIQKEQILYRNKILTLENFELQYLAPKLTTGNNHNYNFSSKNLINENINNNIGKIYYNINSDIKRKKIINSDKKRKLCKKQLNGSQEFKYNIIESFENEDNSFFKNSFNKIVKKSK